ncbi:heavy metal-associated isoprenylated plant protein 6-like, partial [Asparagus officinalis]|uniref:heavy metal-associated isoprenylated plant protein 6-like n=1 Tax=Asparagus officinalis TaxID=4686 RepID=UPI00098E5AE7
TKRTPLQHQQPSLNTHNILHPRRPSHRPHARRTFRDPLRSKSLNPVLSQPQTPNNKPKSINSKGKKAAELPSPASSSRRYLLSESSNSEEFLEPEVSRFRSPRIEESRFVVVPSRIQSVKVEEAKDEKPSSSSSAAVVNKPKEEQVVVLRVSLHCKGCEGKVRKHISKMEGVRSFTTDLANKKVTVIGDVTPLGVLNSISKVKNAQLWPSQTRTSS